MQENRQPSNGGSPSADILSNGAFEITLLAGDLVIMSVPTQYVSKCSWWIMSKYLMERPSHITSFRSLLMDDDGLSIVCDPQSFATLSFLIRPEEFTSSEGFWRAFVIQTKGSADEIPGAVYCLANALSSQGLSIFHISTFEAEVFLIEARKVDTACHILKAFEDPLKASALLEEACRLSNQKQIDSSSCALKTPLAKCLPINNNSGKSGPVDSKKINPISPRLPVDDVDQADDHSVPFVDVKWLQSNNGESSLAIVDDEAPPETSSGDNVSTDRARPLLASNGFKLCLLPQPVILARLHVDDDKSWEECSRALTKLLLFDARFNPLEKLIADTEKEGSSSVILPEVKLTKVIPPLYLHKASFMWGLWQQGSEITLLMEEDDIYSFPSHLLTRSPQRWKIIKLCGRTIGFNETGIVSAMSRVETSIPSLNISTAMTNCTLVPEELLMTTTERLSKVLGCPVQGEENDQ